MNKLVFPAIGAVFSLLNANAAVIFDASPTNSSIVGNAFNLTSNTLSGSTGSLTLTTVASANNNASGLASNDNINTLLGLGLVSTDTVTMKLTVSSNTGNTNIRANGIEFGMAPNSTDFRPTENLMFQIDAEQDASGMAIGNFYDPDLTLNVAGWAVTESGLADGFTVTLVADSSGFTFTLNDITETGNLTNTSVSYSNTFAGTEFIDNFATGHIYYTRQGSGGTANVNISEFSIDVTSIPEPSTALLSFLGFAGLLRRRRAR